ncbi:MAG TPA: M23 family metallopeptidase [Candidatus Polarisedimenticolaceae bacterium]|nr:M23 family metallopeptidase [Candidatus Polarisedimenticolaceae bacterium]
MLSLLLLSLLLPAVPRAAKESAPAPAGTLLDLVVRPAGPVRRHVCDSGATLSFNLELHNRGSRAVHVDAVRFVYLVEDRPLQVERDEDFLPGTWVHREVRVDPGRHVDWPGVCLGQVPEAVTRVRMELDLTSGMALRRRRATQTLEVPIVPDRSTVPLTLPFDGYWRVTQGHGCRSNHRIGGLGGEYSWDFAAINRRGLLASEAYEITHRNADTAAFGQAVLAPVDGKVVRAVGDVPDNDGLHEFPRRSLQDDLAKPDWIFGNHVVLEAGPGIYVLLGHLQQGSLRVEPGALIRRGAPLARCGNSGNTFVPHLHVQVMDRPDPTDPTVRGLPARFEDYVEFRAAGDGASRDVLRRQVDSGDPGEGALVLAPAPPPK